MATTTLQVPMCNRRKKALPKDYLRGLILSGLGAIALGVAVPVQAIPVIVEYSVSPGQVQQTVQPASVSSATVRSTSVSSPAIYGTNGVNSYPEPDNYLPYRYPEGYSTRYPVDPGTPINNSVLVNPTVINSSIYNSTLINPTIVTTPHRYWQRRTIIRYPVPYGATGVTLPIWQYSVPGYSVLGH